MWPSWNKLQMKLDVSSLLLGTDVVFIIQVKKSKYLYILHGVTSFWSFSDHFHKGPCLSVGLRDDQSKPLWFKKNTLSLKGIFFQIETFSPNWNVCPREEASPASGGKQQINKQKITYPERVENWKIALYTMEEPLPSHTVGRHTGRGKFHGKCLKAGKVELRGNWIEGSGVTVAGRQDEDFPLSSLPFLKPLGTLFQQIFTQLANRHHPGINCCL